MFSEHSKGPPSQVRDIKDIMGKRQIIKGRIKFSGSAMPFKKHMLEKLKKKAHTGHGFD